MQGRQTVLREYLMVPDCSTLCRDVLHTVGAQGLPTVRPVGYFSDEFPGGPNRVGSV